jgi:hypothetical protein
MTAPAKPAPPYLSGSDDSARGDTSVFLSWVAVSGATTYDLQFVFGSPPQSTIVPLAVSGNAVPGLTPNRIYAISLRAGNAAGQTSPWSDSLVTATRPSQPLPPYAVRMPGSIAMSIGWTVDLSGMDRPGTLRVDIGEIFGSSSMTPISTGSPVPIQPQPVGLPDDVTVQFYAIRLIDDGSALPGGVINESLWSAPTAPMRGELGTVVPPGMEDPLAAVRSLRRSYGR